MKQPNEPTAEKRPNYRYVAIKVAGLAPWLWFEKSKVTEVAGRFVGKLGWGDGGACTEIDVDTDEIIGRIESTELQYDN